MKTLDVSKLHIIAKEYGSGSDLNRIYVVMKETDGNYDDPLCCVVEIDCNEVAQAQPLHQFCKFCHPVTPEISEEQAAIILEQFVLYSVSNQRRLMQLYDPDIFKRAEPIVSQKVFAYVKQRLYLPLSKKEFEHIETGFRLRWNYSKGKMVGDGDFKLAVAQYLTSIDYPMDLKKMRRIVNLILEYLEWTGQWGYKGRY
jgi:hypothetical protein